MRASLRTIRLWSGILGCWLCVATVVRGADNGSPPAPPTSVVFFDATGADQDATSDVRTSIMFRYADITGSPVTCSGITSDTKYTRQQIWALLECAAGGSLADPTAAAAPDAVATNLEGRAAAATALLAAVRGAADSSSARAISTEGSPLLVVVIEPAVETRAKITEQTGGARGSTSTREIAVAVVGQQPKIAVTEKARDSTFVTDLDALLKVAEAVISKGAARAAPPPRPVIVNAEPLDSKPVVWITLKQHPLRLHRATVSVAATPPTDGASAVLAKGLDAADYETVTKFLGARAEQQAFETGLKGVKNAADELRALSCAQLSDFQRLVPVYVLTCQLKSGSTPAIREAAAKALGKLGTPAAVGVLSDRARDTAEAAAVREAATAALDDVDPAHTIHPATSANPPAAPAASAVSMTILTGPAEHFFISADVFATGADVLTTDSSGAVQVAKPPAFYVAVDYLLGDLPSDHRPLWANLVVKGLFKGSKSPQDSLGFGLGLRGSYLKSYGLDFELISPFVAVTYTKSTDASSSTSRDRQVRVGFSVNVSKALDWLK